MATSTISSLSGYISTLLATYPQQNAHWVRYVLDHWSDVTGTATTVSLSGAEEYKYRYRPALFMIDHQVDRNLTWVFLRLNRMQTDCDFIGRNEVLLPDSTTFAELLEAWRSAAETREALQTKLAG